MDEPMNYALVGEDGVIFNIIWLCAENRAEFPNAICVADRPVAIGDGAVVSTSSEQTAETQETSGT